MKSKLVGNKVPQEAIEGLGKAGRIDILWAEIAVVEGVC